MTCVRVVRARRVDSARRGAGLGRRGGGMVRRRRRPRSIEWYEIGVGAPGRTSVQEVMGPVGPLGDAAPSWSLQSDHNVAIVETPEA